MVAFDPSGREAVQGRMVIKNSIMKTKTHHSSIIVALCIIAVALLGSLLLMPLIYIASEHPQREMARNHSNVDIQGHRFRTVIGKGALASGVTNLVELKGDRALMVSRTGFDADSHPVVAYQIRGGHPGIVGYLIWRSGREPQQLHNVPINLNASGMAYIDMSGNENWTGRIQEIGLDVYGDLRNQQLSPEGVRASGLTYINILRILRTDWMTFKPWDHSSVNSLKWLYKNPITSPIVLAALWMLITLGCLMTLRVAAIGVARGFYVAVVLIPWVAVDMLWQLQLTRQARETYHTFEGLTYAQKQQVVDASLYEYVQHLKESVLSSPEDRVFVIHSSIGGHDYTRLRLQYLLLPANIYNFSAKLPDPQYVRPGDYILLLGEKQGATFSAAERQLTQGNRVLNAVQVDEHSLGKTYRALRMGSVKK